MMLTLAFVILLSMTVCCRREGVTHGKLDLADSLMEDRPDSSLSILQSIDASKLSSGLSKARFALLKSMAMDKNYIDIATFDVLQPAIDHYLFKDKGTADDKLRTLYYQGVVFKNAGHNDLAMETFLNANEIAGTITDSLTLARLLVAQGSLYYGQYRIGDFIDNNLQAGEIYERLGQPHKQLQCYGRVLTGETIIGDTITADSIYNICQSILNTQPSLRSKFLRQLLMYVVRFKDENDIGNLLEEIQQIGITVDMKMNLAHAYTKIGEALIGLKYLDEVVISPDNILDSLTYWSVKTYILECLGEEKNALNAYRRYSRVLEQYHTQLFSNELLFAEKKHEMEMENMASLRKKDDAIKWMLVGVGCLVLIMVLIYYLYRMNRTGRLLAESNAEKLHLEGEKQRLLAEKLESERAQLSLEAENLHLQIDRLEEERRDLKRLLDNQETLSEEARQIIRARIEMLNGLFAQALTDQESYGKEFKKYVERIKRDKKGFQESLVRVLAATHPSFIEELKTHGLTERELHYACLYAIGLRGKEIGNYLNLTRHYNISTEIRRKLGLDPNDRNLGPYLQEKLRKQ